MSKYTDALAAFKAETSNINEHLQTIHDTVRRTRARMVLELGVGYGKSTVAILAALEETGGRLVSVDVLDYPGTREKFKAPNWTFVVGDDREWGGEWTKAGEVLDVLLIDSSHEREHTEQELRLFAPRVRPGGVILMHDPVSFPAVREAIDAWRDPGAWTLTVHENNNGLAVLERISRGRCLVPMGHRLDSTSGPTVLTAALTEALEADERFAPFAGEHIDADILWAPTYCDTPALLDWIRAGREVAIGPNVVFADSRRPGAGPHEPEILAYDRYRAIFFLSRWYAELGRSHFRQQTRHRLVDFPLPFSWRAGPWRTVIDRDAMVYLKGGPAEEAVAAQIAETFPTAALVRYGAFTRERLLQAARTSRACFYVSREDHYPLAAVEIGLMGCPIISDERSCPVALHGLTGVVVPVREWTPVAPFEWSDTAGEDLAAMWDAAIALDRARVRETVLTRHDPGAVVRRIATALGV